MNDPIVTEELIERLRTPAFSWTRKSLAYLGVEYPPRKGWKSRIIGGPRRPVEHISTKGTQRRARRAAVAASPTLF